jgi:hypothetical protein
LADHEAEQKAKDQERAARDRAAAEDF